jgi:hypothetical protein
MLMAAFLRVWHVDFGLPAIYNPDEISIMNRAVALGQNHLNPQNFLYPSLYFYLLFVWEGLWYVTGRLFGVFGSLADFERAFFAEPTSIYVAGRLLSAAMGVATVWATWRLGARLGGARAGIAAATLMAVAPLAVRDAHYVKHDVPVTLLTVLALNALAAAMDTGRRRSWIGAGLLAGLAISTHYYAVFVMVPGLLLMAKPGAGDRRSNPTTYLVAAVAAFAATSPFVLLEWQTAVRDVTANREIVMDRATDAGGALATFGYYLEWLVTDAVSPIALALALVGAGILARSGSLRLLLMLGFAIPFMLFIGNTIPASRYLNPVLPLVAVLAGVALDASLRSPRRAVRVVGVLAFAVAVLHATALTIRINRFFGETDTRTLAQRWIEREVPAEASVLIQPYSVQLRQSRAALDEALAHHLGDPAKATIKFQRQRGLVPYPTPAYRLLYLGSGGLDVDRIYIEPRAFDSSAGLEPLRAASVTYVVLKRYNEPDPSIASLSRALETRARLVATFSPYRSDADPGARAATPPFLHNTGVRVGAALERPGPIVDIWRLN